MIHVLVVDDHPLVRDGVRALLARTDDMLVVGDATDADSAMATVASCTPDVVVTDIAMPEGSGLEVIERIGASSNPVPIVVLSMFTDESTVQRSLALGAQAYVVKGADSEELILAIRSVARGATFISSAVRDASKPDAVRPSSAGRRSSGVRPTPREQEVLELVAQGLTNKAIARRLGISVKTVEHHRGNLMSKLDVNNIVGLLRVALREGLIELPDPSEEPTPPGKPG